VEINLIRGQNPGGPGFIGGRISDGANRPPEGGSSGGPLPDNLTIVLMKPDGTPVASAQADAQGNYSFPNLPYGTYVVWIDIPGQKPVSSNVTISADRPRADGINFKIGKNSITTTAKETELQQIARIYPNPVSDVVWLELNTEAQLSLSNSHGQLVQQLKAPAGTTSLDMATLPSGLYFINVRRPDSVQTFKVVKR
jgi:Secretion system C-terminal sorting domain/Carboxypeptidase regulatory-like domain